MTDRADVQPHTEPADGIEEMRIAYLALLLSRADLGGDQHLLNRIERCLGLAESDTQLFDRIERALRMHNGPSSEPEAQTRAEGDAADTSMEAEPHLNSTPVDALERTVNP